jgi:hypothetical protein
LFFFGSVFPSSLSFLVANQFSNSRIQRYLYLQKLHFKGQFQLWTHQQRKCRLGFVLFFMSLFPISLSFLVAKQFSNIRIQKVICRSCTSMGNSCHKTIHEENSH